MTSIYEQWREYREYVLPRRLRPSKVAEYRRAFYAGASVVLVRGIPVPAEEGQVLTKEEAQYLNLFWKEITIFLEHGTEN